MVGYIDARYEPAENTLFIFLEYVPGGSIASMLERFGCFHTELVRKYTRQLLQVGVLAWEGWVVTCVASTHGRAGVRVHPLWCRHLCCLLGRWWNLGRSGGHLRQHLSLLFGAWPSAYAAESGR